MSGRSPLPDARRALRPAFLDDAARLLKEGVPWAGLAGDAPAFVLGRVAREGRWLVVADESDRATALVRALRFFHPKPDRILTFPADDVRPYDGFSPDPEVPRARLLALHKVAQGDDVVLVTTAAALRQRVPSAAARARGVRELVQGGTLDRDALIAGLTDAGYLATARVMEPGSYAVRGDVVDVWGTGWKSPVRVDFFDDEIEALRRFDPQSQRAGRAVERVTVLPAREERLDQAALERARQELARLSTEQERGAALRRRVIEEWAAGVRFSMIEAWLPALVETESPLDALADCRVILIGPPDVGAALREHERSARSRWEDLDDDERPLVPPEERYVPAADVLRQLATAHPVLDFAEDRDAADLGTRPLDGFAVRGAELGPVVKRLEDLAGEGLRVGLVVEHENRVEALTELLGNHGLYPKLVSDPWSIEASDVSLLVGGLSHGFVAESSGWAFIPVGALFGERRLARKAQRAHAFFETAVQNLAQLKEGDHVVHRLHGIGVYRGLQRLPAGEAHQDFVRLEYRGGDLLYLPVTKLEQISRYTPSKSEVNVTLDRLGGATWAARRGKVRDSLLAMANELLAVYARRELAARPAYPPPGKRYRAFEARFPYEETPDQATAIAAIHDDLSQDAPMDRLICGDVGFGKTEVSMRAAMRAIEAGRQVAVLCPTTVLAFQHHARFTERFAASDVTVGMLSRFTTPAEERDLRAGLRAGDVQIVIGTTKLLAGGVRYKDLGLLVIDEEHRFGVKQKERLKKLRAGLDVLSLSATPIPRTLEMALSGLRDMSVMATPPRDRLEVRTSVARPGKSRVRDTILAELARHGQVFFIHNRVQTIDHIADRLREWVPEARFAVAHGQMSDEALEQVLVEFIRKQYDVLVCTAIVESGVDLENVNTMIIDDADHFGLAQLYQLRGRVGRSSVRATCLLLVPEDITKDARQRLRVLVENTSLGAGFQIATADLEMRGGGNLVGEAQSGNIDAVGYDTWLELLDDAVHTARGELDRSRIDPEIEVPVDAFIPENHVPDVQDRLAWYRRLAAAADEGMVDRLMAELEATQGEPPQPLQNLAGLLVAKLHCRALGIVRCTWMRVRVVLELHPASKIGKGRLDELVADHPKRFAVRREPGEPVKLDVRFLPQEAERPFRFLRWVFAQLAAAPAPG